mmetsp:Transcript_501/g.622  ORF Transcript_501/g.622 Transcript_501/m.622 type:complete len:83 (-) Transcript_501:1391-1639(-)
MHLIKSSISVKSSAIYFLVIIFFLLVVFLLLLPLSLLVLYFRYIRCFVSTYIKESVQLLIRVSIFCTDQVGNPFIDPNLSNF